MTLQDVQRDIHNQITRDYDGRSRNTIQQMMVLGLVEEAGEVAGIFKRIYRNFERDRSHITKEHLIEELGDVLWYLTALCDSYGITLEDIYEKNVKKLEDRYGQH